MIQTVLYKQFKIRIAHRHPSMDFRTVASQNELVKKNIPPPPPKKNMSGPLATSALLYFLQMQQQAVLHFLLIIFLDCLKLPDRQSFYRCIALFQFQLAIAIHFTYIGFKRRYNSLSMLKSVASLYSLSASFS